MATRLKNLYEKYINLFGKTFLNDVISMVVVLIIFIFFLSLIFILIFNLKQSDGLVPLVYNSIYSVTSSVSWYKLFFLPISYLGICIINILISWAFFEKERLISYLLLFSTMIMGIFMIISVYNLTVL